MTNRMTRVDTNNDDRSVVAIWRTSWLPSSETFIANQTAALRRWRPLRVGVRTLSDGLAVVPDRAPFDRRLVSRIHHRISENLGYRWAYDRWLRDQRVRLIHAHFGPGGIKVLPIARRTGIPLAVTFHGFDATSAAAEPGPTGDRYRRELRTLFAEADRLIAVSDFIAGKLIGLGAPESKIRVHYIGTPVNNADSAVNSSPVVWAAEPTIVFVGRLIPVKGVDHLLRAVGQLSPAVRSLLSVQVIGWGSEVESLRRLAVDLAVPAQFLGKLTTGDVDRVLAAGAIFCGPSVTRDQQSEAFGVVYLEAALRGLPVVAYRSGGVAEAVQDGVTGLLADEGDIAGLATHLSRLLENPALACEMGAAGAARVRRDFDIDSQTEKLELIYDEIVGAR